MVFMLHSLVPKLMYGFGDDKQVANDTVNVMEEILIEYIVDVVSVIFCATPLKFGSINLVVSNGDYSNPQSQTSNRGFAASTVASS